MLGTSLNEDIFGHDSLYGDSGDDNLHGGAGDDLLSGGRGADYFDGGDGIDTADFTYSSGNFTADLTLGIVDWGTSQETLVSIENLTGSVGNNVLDGYSGDDILIGGLGNDILIGGLGADIFKFESNAGQDIIADFEDGIDLIDISSTGLTFDDLSISQVGADTILDDGQGNTITLMGIDQSLISSTDFI